MRKYTYDELKKENRVAHSSLITLWEELSRTSRETARKDLKENWGDRYSVTGELTARSGLILTFNDMLTGDSFLYDKDRGEW